MIPMRGAGRDYQLIERKLTREEEVAIEIETTVAFGVSQGLSRKYIAKRLGIRASDVRSIEKRLKDAA